MRADGYFVGMVTALSALPGCSTLRQGEHAYQTIPTSIQRNIDNAKTANERGLEWVEQKDLVEAEKAFREALRHDLNFAAAHNNLGLVLLTQNKLYEAAIEFRAASRLQPRAVEPILNLARLYERVGWEKEAKAQYEKATALGVSLHPTPIGFVNRKPTATNDPGQ